MVRRVLEKFTHQINALLAKLVIALFASLLACVLWQVLSRYVLTSPSTFTDELARLLFIWTGLIGAACAAGQKQHLAINLLPQLLSGSKRQCVLVIIELCTALFAFLILIVGGCLLLKKVITTGQVTPVMAISMAYGYAAIPVSGVFMLYFSIDGICRTTPVEDQ